jgi:hypothetical protein
MIGLCTLVKFVRENISDSSTQQSLITTLLALAIKNDPICVAPPKASLTTVTVACHCHQHFCLKTWYFDSAILLCVMAQAL